MSSRPAVRDRLQLVVEVGFLEEFSGHQLTGNSQAFGVEALRAVHDQPVKQEIGKLLFGIDAGHRCVPPFNPRAQFRVGSFGPCIVPPLLNPNPLWCSQGGVARQFPVKYQHYG